MAQDSVHRYNQPPSKVLHVRNLPYEVTQDELADLCAPFGRLVQTKLNVGSNKNQAFVEFPDTQTAIQMVTYFASSADPAKVRGKTVYLQYSTRQEIVNSSSTAENPSNVLLVSLENLMSDVVVTLDTLYLVFSAFGQVQKIATFEKNSGFQALVQYADLAVSDQVRRELDGRHIPRQLLNDTVHPPMFKISFSQHTDLNIKFQSHRSRDYTNQYLPVASTGQDTNIGIQAPSTGNPAEGNVLLCAIENKAYPVTVDPLQTVFSPYGYVQKLAIFEKNGVWQALVQFPDDLSAYNAKQALDGHAIYDGGFNRLKINFSVHRDLNVRANNERSWDYTMAAGVQPQQPVLQQLQQPVLQQPVPQQIAPNGLPPPGSGMQQPVNPQQEPYGRHESLGSAVGMKRGRQMAGLGDPLHGTGINVNAVLPPARMAVQGVRPRPPVPPAAAPPVSAVPYRPVNLPNQLGAPPQQAPPPAYPLPNPAQPPYGPPPSYPPPGGYGTAPAQPPAYPPAHAHPSQHGGPPGAAPPLYPPPSSSYAQPPAAAYQQPPGAGYAPPSGGGRGQPPGSYQPPPVQPGPYQQLQPGYGQPPAGGFHQPPPQRPPPIQQTYY